MSRTLPLLLMPLTLAGCGHSPPTRFFTLAPSPAQAPVGEHATAGNATPLHLGAVHIPAALDRPEMVTQEGDNQLTLHEQRQWAAPLAQLIRRTLAQDLMAEMPEGAFVAPDAPAPSSARTVTVDFLALDARPDGSVRCLVAWTLLSPSGDVLLRRSSRLHARGPVTPGGQAQAISTILAHLARRMAAAASQ